MTATILHFPSQQAMHAYVRGEVWPEAVIVGGEVRPHVQAFADAVVERFPDIGTIGTYPGHDPSMELALDIFPKSREQGDELAEWAVANIEPYAIDYVIWWQRIFNPEILPAWRPMADRGSITQNHKDHNHFSFEATGSATPKGGFLMALNDDEQAALKQETHETWEALGGFQDLGKTILSRLGDVERRLNDLEAGGGSVDVAALAAKVTTQVLDGLAIRLKA